MGRNRVSSFLALGIFETLFVFYLCFTFLQKLFSYIPWSFLSFLLEWRLTLTRGVESFISANQFQYLRTFLKTCISVLLPEATSVLGFKIVSPVRNLIVNISIITLCIFFCKNARWYQYYRVVISFLIATELALKSFVKFLVWFGKIWFLALNRHVNDDSLRHKTPQNTCPYHLPFFFQ